MWMNDIALKMYMDAEVRERVEQARQGYELSLTRRLSNLVGAVRRVQAELDIAERASAGRGSRLVIRRG